MACVHHAFLSCKFCWSFIRVHVDDVQTYFIMLELVAEMAQSTERFATATKVRVTAKTAEEKGNKGGGKSACC
jgi:hypothetical protein